VLVAKYADHTPLYRQAQIYARQGITLDRSTLADWVGRAAFALRPVHARLLEQLKQSTKLFADETTAPVLDPGRGRVKKGQLWAYARDERPWAGHAPPGVAYVYAPDRKHARPAEHLAGFRGTLQVDGYGAYTELAQRGDVVLAFCWSHVRRQFYDIQAKTPAPIATEALVRIAPLYAVEADIRGLSADERRQARQRRSKPLVDALRLWLEAQLAAVSGKSTIAAAIRYALSRWDGLARFLDDGRVEIGRVDDWRGGCRSRGVAVVRRLSPNAGASFRTVAPFPVAARQTGRAELPHPAFSHPIRPSLSAGRSAGGECGRGRASHRDTRPGSGGTRRLVSQLGASTSGGVVDLCTS
jgi:Transposase IS66 family